MTDWFVFVIITCFNHSQNNALGNAWCMFMHACMYNEWLRCDVSTLLNVVLIIYWDVCGIISFMFHQMMSWIKPCTRKLLLWLITVCWVQCNITLKFQELTLWSPPAISRTVTCHKQTTAYCMDWEQESNRSALLNNKLLLYKQLHIFQLVY